MPKLTNIVQQCLKNNKFLYSKISIFTEKKMREAVAVAKEADAKRGFSPTKSDKSVQYVQDEPERQLGSLRGVICNISRDGGTPSVDSIATQLSSMHTAQHASVLLALQQTHGNRYVQRVVAGIQAKLVVGQPGDKYEQEADRVADAVMQMPEPRVQQQVLKEEEEKLVIAKEISEKTPVVSDNLDARLNWSIGSEQPLPNENMTFMESRFEGDFSCVRAHTNTQATQMARDLNAEAFTSGRDVYFGAGRFNPGASTGKMLLAHELTRVLQQRRSVAGALVKAKLKVGQPRDVHEQEAEWVSRQILQIGISREHEDFNTQNRRNKGISMPLISKATNETLGNKGSGKPLNPAVHAIMEPRFGVDLSNVHIHTDTEAHRYSAMLGARAFTYGQDIFLGKGESELDFLLIAHELTHVIQQSTRRGHQYNVEDQSQKPELMPLALKFSPTNDLVLQRAIDFPTGRGHRVGVITNNPGGMQWLSDWELSNIREIQREGPEYPTANCTCDHVLKVRVEEWDSRGILGALGTIDYLQMMYANYEKTCTPEASCPRPTHVLDTSHMEEKKYDERSDAPTSNVDILSTFKSIADIVSLFVSLAGRRVPTPVR
jgi:hypothetical protein